MISNKFFQSYIIKLKITKPKFSEGLPTLPILNISNEKNFFQIKDYRRYDRYMQDYIHNLKNKS